MGNQKIRQRLGGMPLDLKAANAIWVEVHRDRCEAAGRKIVEEADVFWEIAREILPNASEEKVSIKHQEIVNRMFRRFRDFAYKEVAILERKHLESCVGHGPFYKVNERANL